MADWNTTDHDNILDGFDSRRSSGSSGHLDNKENKTCSYSNTQMTDGNSNERELILRGATELNGESRTELSPTPASSNLFELSRYHGKDAVENTKSKDSKNTNATSSTQSWLTDDVNIPSDANISSFTCDQLVSFLKCLKVDDKIISHLHRKSVDGKRFSKLKDSELDTLGMNNPVVVFFRNKSNSKVKGKGPFML